MKPAAEKYIIEQLIALKITSGRNGESLYEMDYYSLRSLLAVKRAVNE
ncbi:hypothetical protein [Sporosarcina psychrophila]|uniref:Fur-regulated basic protein FbpA n=1 Tax=Sporosarcina psychrophila TaxID=1476 RepID=A0ABV2KAM3_SPOPS